MRRCFNCIAACALCAHAVLCQATPSDIIFADGFEFPYISPVWLPDACNVPAAAATYVANTPIAFNTDTDPNCTIVAQTNGPEICVVRAKAIAIGSTMTVSGMRALALVADDSLVVGGTINVSAHGAMSGPGGGFRTSGAVPTVTKGGGGAGFATDGGAGGNFGGSGGAATDPLGLAVFEGGSRAASGSGALDPDGGGGGGALLLIACRGLVTTAGIITAGGGGGEPTRDTVVGGVVAETNSAGGGGAGGYVVIQGLALDIGGGLFANGGGGGGGNSVNDSSGASGDDGKSSTVPASGGSGSGTGSKGGNGGALAAAPTNGGATTGAAAGGGGGSAGVLQLCVPTGVDPVIEPSLSVSPDLSPLLGVPTKH